MAKKYSNRKKRDTKKAALVKITAEVIGVSTRTVERVTEGTQNNELVFETFMNIKEGFDKVIEENKLLLAVEKLVPFNTPTRKIASN